MEKSFKLKTADEVVAVIADEPEYFPVPVGDGLFDVKIGHKSEELTIPPRMSFTIDCGFDMQLPHCLVPCVQLNDDFAKKGMVLTWEMLSGNVRCVLRGHNIGKQIIALNPGDVLGRMFFVHRSNVALASKLVEKE